MSAPINGFRVYSYTEEMPPYMSFYKKYTEIEVFNSSFDIAYYAIKHQKHEKYRIIQYTGNQEDLNENLEKYLKFIYEADSL